MTERRETEYVGISLRMYVFPFIIVIFLFCFLLGVEKYLRISIINQLRKCPSNYFDPADLEQQSFKDSCYFYEATGSVRPSY